MSASYLSFRKSCVYDTIITSVFETDDRPAAYMYMYMYIQFAESYTISHCANSDHCGTFRRVAANCTSGYRCPGGFAQHSNSTDPSLCNGAPVYQLGGSDGPVLFRWEWSPAGEDSSTYWKVTDSSALENCWGSSSYLFSASNYQAGGGSPIAPAYITRTNWNGHWDGRTGWQNLDASPWACTSGCGIVIAAGGRY